MSREPRGQGNAPTTQQPGQTAVLLVLQGEQRLRRGVGIYLRFKISHGRLKTVTEGELSMLETRSAAAFMGQYRGLIVSTRELGMERKQISDLFLTLK